MNHDLNDLARKARQGDMQAFSDIVKQMQQPLFRYCYPMLADRQEAEDAIQDTFIRAYRHLHHYKDQGKFSSWLFTIAHRICLNKLKKRNKQDRLLSKLAHEEMTKSTHLEDVLDNQDIFALLYSLKPKVRAIMILRIVHEWSYREISRVTGMSESRLRKQYERARKQLQQEYGLQGQKHTELGGIKVELESSI